LVVEMSFPKLSLGQYAPGATVPGPYGVPSDIPRYETPREPQRKLPGEVEEEGKPIDVPPPRGQETLIIPSIAVSERYDSNVYFIQQGQNLEDFVTTVNPQLRVEHLAKYLNVIAFAGVTGEYYAKNTGLSYIGTNGSVNLVLDKAIQQILRKATLQVSDIFSYTPQPPGFLAPTTGGAIPETFVRGIQAARANALTNMAMISGSYAFTPQTALQGAYTNSYIQFANTSTSAPLGTFFTTMFHTLNAGPRFQVSRQDTITTNYQYQKAEFSTSGGFESQGGTIAWERQISPTLKASIQGGGTKISGIDGIQYLADAMIQWTGKQSTASAHYSRVVAPSFFIAGAPLVSNLLSAIGTYAFTPATSGTLAANYAEASSVGSVSLAYTSYGGTASLAHILTRLVTLTASYTYSYYKTEFSGSSYDFNRNIAMLTARMEWR